MPFLQVLIILISLTFTNSVIAQFSDAEDVFREMETEELTLNFFNAVGSKVIAED